MATVGPIDRWTSSEVKRVSGWRRVVSRIDGVGLSLAGVCLLMVLLGILRLDQYPAAWFDEGIHLQVAHNLITDGTYAARSADGTLDYAPAIGVGPTVLLPVAGALELFGANLAAGRAVIVIYLVVATALLFLISSALFGRVAAFATIALVLAMPALDWIESGRQVLGELPALAFLLLGGLLVYRSRGRSALVGAGIVLGLALVTKGQYVLIVPATLLALAVIDWRWTRHRPLSWHATLFVVVVGTWAAWIATLLLLIGDGNVIENVSLLRDTSGGALLVFDAGRMLAAWKVVLGPSSLFIVVPAALAGLLAIRLAEGERRLALLGLWLFQAAWLGWFVVASIGWPRYAFAGLAINAIFAGVLIDRGRVVALAWLMRRAPRPVPWAAPASLAILILFLLAGVGRSLEPAVNDGSRDAQRFAETVETLTPPEAVINGWEPEVGFLIDRAIQPPPPGSLDEVVRARWFGGAMPDYSAGLQGEYLIIGPFARWVGAYRAVAGSADWQRLTAVGPYELYRGVSSGMTATSKER